MASKWTHIILAEVVESQRGYKLEPFKLATATAKQDEAIRGLATQVGFKDLRGFWSWVKSAGLDYYDLIKVASPE